MTFALPAKKISSRPGISNRPAAPLICNRVDLAVRAAFVLALAAILCGCSASEIVQNWTPRRRRTCSQPNFRRIIADNIKTIFPNQQPVGEIEISGVRPVDHLKGPAWLTCLKLDARGNPQHYAIFIQGDRILDVRAGIIIDQCHKETYSSFQIPSVANKPATRSEQADDKIELPPALQ